MFGNAFIPLFILIFFILIFIIYIWYQKKDRDKETIKPKYSIPTKKPPVEGFQAVNAPLSGSELAAAQSAAGGAQNYNAAVSTATSIDSRITQDNMFTIGSSGSRYANQFDIIKRSSGSKRYGQWDKTAQDSFYETYEQNEQYAAYYMTQKLKDISPVIKPIPNYGGRLGTFDSDNIKIPWDSDNNYYNQEDIVWGVVSEQASRSIYLKTWIQNILMNAAQLEPCSQDNMANYCYRSPLFAVSTTDPAVGGTMMTSEAMVQGLGQYFQTQAFDRVFGTEKERSKTSFKEKVQINRNSITNGLQRITNAFSSPRVETVRAQVGPHIRSAGNRKSAHLARGLQDLRRALLRSTAASTKAAVVTNSAAAIASANTAAGLATAAAASNAGVNPILTAAAVVATAVAAFVNWFFGFFALFLMIIETLIDPIIMSMFSPGGVCPPGSNRLSTLISETALTLIAAFIPIGSFLQLFDPYVCWNNAGAQLMKPPKVPSFMADNTLSLIFHAAWMGGNIPGVTTTNPTLNIISDPLPPNFKWIPESDLANNPSINHILSSQSTLNAATGGSSNSRILSTRGSGSSLEPFVKYIAVETCPSGTTPSPDGYTCVSDTYQTRVVRPYLTPCAATETDDGQNCWIQPVGECTGEGIILSPSSSWNDTYGFFTVSGTARTCTGATSSTNAITKTFNQRSQCEPGYEKDNGGLLCYAKCQDGYTRIGAICKGGPGITRQFKWGTHSMYYDQAINNETMETLDDVKIPYCDFSSPVMLDKMAQFYYNNSINNPQLNEDGTVTVQMITGFLGVIASSELSCDVACTIRFITYDPVTGGSYQYATDGCTKNYAGDPYFEGCPFCYRRFYFIRGDKDPQGQFTVTACTFADYTAPDVMVYTGDLSSNIIQSLPKKWKDSKDPSKRANIIYKDAGIQISSFEQAIADPKVWQNAGINMLDLTVTLGAAAVGGVAAGVVVGGATPWMHNAIVAAANCAISPAAVSNSIDTMVYGQGNNLSVSTNTQYYTIKHGPVYELAEGYVPKINFCQTRVIGIEHCGHKYIVRDMVDKYHNENATKHIRYITDIEPRGKSGCYYKFKEVDYNALTNLESDIETEKEVILQHEIKDYATCTYAPTTFINNITDPNYPVRSIVDPSTIGAPTPRILYPTRDTVYTSDLTARFVRVRPPIIGGDGYLNLAQIAVFDISGFNISVQKRTYATSTFSGAMNAKEVVNGTIDASGATLSSIWQQATPNRNTEYFEIDLSQNMVISEVVYFGGSIASSRNQGVRIEFLYSNGASETPIHTITLPTDSLVHYLPVYSSFYTRPSYPLSGPFKVPRPVVNGRVLGANKNCINKCDDKAIIDNLVSQYNTQTAKNKILKVIKGITTSSNTCEYQTQMLVNDIAAGSSDPSTAKSSIVNQFVSMQLSAPEIKKVAGNVFARFVKITPSFTPGTVLEISKLLVWNTIGDSVGNKRAGYNVAQGKQNGLVNYYNEYYQLNEMPPPPPPKVDVTDGGNMEQNYPRIFRAADNDPNTHFTVDLAPTDGRSCIGKNYEIFQIQFVGRADRMLGGIKGIKIELYRDMSNTYATYNASKCCDGTYPPIFTYTLPSDETTQLFTVSPVATCSFTLNSTELLAKPLYLQDNVAPLSAPDTSGGVFTFSNILSNLGSTWSSISTLDAQALTVPVLDNAKESNRFVRQMLETISPAQTIGTTGKRCTDTDVMSMMMTLYNIARGPKDTDEYGVLKNTMNRILKVGQATPTQCDVMFENLYEIYDDYIDDITDPTNKGKEIKGVRFNMGSNGLPMSDAARAPQKNIIDISANALGIMSDSSGLARPFTGPTYAIDCRNLGNLLVIKSVLENGTSRFEEYTTRGTFKTVKQSFQTTPLSCEYMMAKDITLTKPPTNYLLTIPDNETYVKAVYTIGPTGIPSLPTVTEYDPSNITLSADYKISYLNGVEVTLPSIYSYDPKKLTSKRVNSTPIQIG